MRRLGIRWRLRRTRGMRQAMEFEWVFCCFLSNASDYLTRSVRRASDFVLDLTANHILTIKMRSVSFLLMTKRSSCAHDYNAE